VKTTEGFITNCAWNGDTGASHDCSTAVITDVMKLKYCQIISKLAKDGYVRKGV
jgi:hypothetical protein